MCKKGIKKMLAMIVAFCLVVSMMPWNALVAIAETTTGSSQTSELDTAKAKAKDYIDALTINNSSNDPSTVVTDNSKFFTWDNEKRSSANKNPYLYEWSYYNGVVFEGLDYVYDATGEEKYKTYVDEYLSSMITDGKLNDYAGYVNYHGADCYKTASLLLDYGYTDVAATLYQDLQKVQGTYTSTDRNGNYNHTWKDESTYNLWLDGLYMIQPFMAEYAASIGDQDELNRIVARFTWVSENMYDSTTKLYYHMANSSSDYYNNNNQYWGRAIGWYAAAMVDVMDNMNSNNMPAMKTQFKKLVDGMKEYQTDDGMWRQFVNVSSSSNETSVTALMAYAIQKAVNNGWLDSSYAQYAQKAFIGICNYSLKDDGLHYICEKGGYDYYAEPTSVDEGKGVGPFIMAYAEMLKATDVTDNIDSSTGDQNASENTPSSGDSSTESETSLNWVDVSSEGTETTYSNVQSMDSSYTGGYVILRSSYASLAYDNSTDVKANTNVKSIPANSEYITENDIWYIDDEGHIYCKINNKKYYLRANSGDTLTTKSSRAAKWKFDYVDGKNIRLRTTDNQYYLRYSDSDFNIPQTNDTSNTGLLIYKRIPGTPSVSGQATLSGTLSYTIKIGESLTEDQIKSAASILYRSDETVTTPDTIPWDDSSVTYSWNNALDTDTVGTYIMNVYYNDINIGSITVSVEKKALDKTQPNWGLDATPEKDYPEYPNDGAVRINKKATNEEFQFTETGVTKVELDVAGISVKKGVNVILVADISNSMSWDDSEYDYSDTTVTVGSNQRLNASKDAAKTFVNSLLADSTDGSKTKNTVTLLAFAGIDGDYNTHSTAKNNDDVYQVGDLAMTSVTEAENAIDSLEKAKTGGTNYDYAFQQAYAKAEELYKANGNEVHIVFMTDGVPTHYNGVYYKKRENTDLTACMQYVDPTTGETSSYTSTGNDRNGNDIDSTDTQDITVYYNNGTTATKNVTYNKGWSNYVTENTNGWAEKVKGLDYVAKVYSIGFGMKNGSVTQGATTYMPTLKDVNGGAYYIPYSVTKTLLQTIASTPSDYYEAENKNQLSTLYASLATKIMYAGTDAQVTDNVKSDFDVQMAQFSTIKGETSNMFSPKIEVTAYDLVTKSEATDEKPTGTRTGTSSVIETVTFNKDGTEAYSDQVSGNIMSKVNGVTTINAKYFTYTKTADSTEKFVWNIGNITDKEIALSYYAYLTGTMENTREEGVYDTNEDAILEYVDINGNYAKKIFPLPKVNWGGAVTTVEYYLANENGVPVNRMGQQIPFANRIIVSEGTYYKFALGETKKVYGAAPTGYQMCNPNACYTVRAEANGTGNLTIDDTMEFTDIGTSKTMTSTQRVDTDTASYNSTKVAFAVYKFEAEPANPELFSDKIVIDYGKEIHTDVLENDQTNLKKVNCTAQLVGFAKYNAETAEEDIKKVQANKGLSEFAGDYGRFTIAKDGKVIYQPTKMMNGVEHIYAVIKVTNNSGSSTADFYYQYNVLSIIPATMMYYETDFSSSTFKFTGTKTGTETESAWSKSTVTGDSAADGLQDDGTIGVNQTYGYDSTYENDTYLSNGSSYFVDGQGRLKTYTDFSFTGTGFDLISRTGDLQGAIRVDIYKDSAMKDKLKSITVLNKSESNLELYQIPVVSVNDLTYGTYYVRIGVSGAYTDTDNPSLSRGGQFYFDAIRIYDPINTSSTSEDATTAKDAYSDDGEYGHKITEVRSMLLDSTTYDNSVTPQEGVLFVDRGPSSVDVGTYETIGPNNEVYLKSGQAIAFKISATDGIPASIDIGAKSADGKPVTLSATIANATGTNATKCTLTKNIKTSTSLYYDMLSQDTSENDIVAYFDNDGYAYVTITNTADNILSITDIKIAYQNTVSTASFLSDNYVLDFATFCLMAPEVVEANYDIQSAEFTSSSCSLLKKATMTVITTTDVEELKVTNKYGTKMSTEVTSTINEEGMKVWTVKFRPLLLGTQSFTVTGYGADGTEGASATASIKVKLF